MRLYLTMCSSDRCELGVYMQTLKTEFPVCPLISNVEHVEQIHDLIFLDAKILLDKSTCHCCEMCVSCTETFAKSLL